MKSFNKLSIIAVCLFLFIACATPEYQRAGENGTHRLGYTEIKISDLSYRITYLGRDPNNAFLGFMRRASELSINSGFDYFTTRDVGNLKENGPLIHVGSGVIQDYSLPQYEATIIMHKNSVQDSINAHEFLKNNPIPKKIEKPTASSTPRQK